MPTFISHGLTIAIGEMSRAAALMCARDFNSLIEHPIYSDDASLLAELEVLCAIYAPVVVKSDSGIISGKTTVGDFEIAIPITREIFDKLPYTLTRAWIEAAVNANDWIVTDLKNAYRRIAQRNVVPPSGSGPSSEQTEPSPTMTTTGSLPTPTP